MFSIAHITIRMPFGFSSTGRKDFLKSAGIAVIRLARPAMTEDKVKEVLDRLSACIEEDLDDLDACVGWAAVLARTSRRFEA